MKIKLNLQIFIFIIIFIITKQIKMYGILMLFAFIHELGHMLAGIVMGLKPCSLKIMPFGLSVDFKVNAKDYNTKVKNGTKLTIKKMIIALMGPVTNLIFVVIYCFWDNTFLGIPREYVVYSNILIGIFNLIPIYPLDGGRIVKEIVHIFYGNIESYKTTNLISKITITILSVTVSIGILYFKNIALLIIIAYLWYLFFIEDKRFKKKMDYFHIPSSL